MVPMAAFCIVFALLLCRLLLCTRVEVAGLWHEMLKIIAVLFESGRFLRKKQKMCNMKNAFFSLFLSNLEKYHNFASLTFKNI